MQRIKRTICFLLSVALLLSVMPLNALASEITGTEDNPWNGKSAVFVGDSITAGSGTTKIYYSFLEEALGFDSVTAMGVGGSCISAASDYGTGNQPLISRYQNIPSTDLIVIFMGTNDYGHETPLGSVEDTKDGTFYGALNTIIPALIAKHTSSKIVFVTPLHRYGFGTSKILGTQFTYDNIPNGIGATLGDYVDALKTVCANNGVSVIDLHTECTLDPSDAAVRSTYMPDGLHPNASGHEVIAEIIESHLRTFEPAEAPETNPTEPAEPAPQTELVYGNRFASGFSQQNRASSRVNYYLKAGTVITLKDPATFQWACARSSDENSSSNLGYQWTDKVTAVVAEDGWIGFTFKYRDETQSFDLTKPLSDYITIEEPHVHSYTSAVTAPTCTEQGYATYTCECGDSYVDDYVEATGHTYENGSCTACGTEHPNLANYEGKVISILGDSISTFAGYIPVADGFNLAHRARYPQSNLLTDVNETWWMQVLTELDAKLGVNDSWAGSRVSNTISGNSGDYGEMAAMASLTRIQNLGSNGTPDVILFYGGTNDIGALITLGTFDSSTAPTEVDLNSTKWNSVADAYVAAILRMQYYYPNAEIVAMLPTYTSSYYTKAELDQYNSVFGAICEHYGVTYVDLRDCGITTANLPDGIHPDAIGMDYITKAVISILQNECDMQAGENVVHSVSHNLSGAESSLGYYKGVTHGKPFIETITGEKLTVTITMGGADITNTAYADGVVTIAEVTGDVVITAKGRLMTIYEDHLQQLPAKVCSCLNLWTSLSPENTYYTGSGWGNISGNAVCSVTIPVAVGDQLWATSFQRSGTNGGGRNGIRITWFDESGVLKSVSPDDVYAEFSANGYVTVPEGAVAVNIPMWKMNDSNTIYIRNREHTYNSGTCAACGVASWDTDGDGALEILTIGNSFSVDAMEYVYQIAESLGIEHIVLGNLYKGSCTLATHANNAKNNTAAYAWFYNDNGTWSRDTNTWKDAAEKTMGDALQERTWDFVSLQQASGSSGQPDSYNADLNYLIEYVSDNAPGAKLVWHMTWAYQQNTTHSAFPTYGKNQMTMYNAIVSAVQSRIVTNGNFDLIVPNGTAVQNSRTSLLGDTTTIDGYHMSRPYGRYLTSLMFVKAITGLDIANISYMPSGVSAEEKQIAIESVNHAYKTPFAVTESVYQKEDVVIPEGYVEQNLGLTALGYWNSSDKNGDHNGIITTADNSKQYYATVQFSREHLPVGSAIVLAEGWQYRPEGWINGGVNTSANRPTTTTASYVEITEEWWDNYSTRAFNISKVGLSSLSGVTEADICEAFQIYVPTRAHIHTYTPDVTAPTCTEQGYTTYTCACGDSYVDDYVNATGEHAYENGICTGCGEEDYNGLDLNGLNVLCLGDSITAGQGLTTETRWTNVLASKYGWNLTNKSQGGISLSSYYYTANGKSDVSIAKKAEILKTMTTKPDVIIVWGGHNDTSYRYSPLGTWDDETTNSFKGALKYIAELADEYAPDATLFVLTPLWTTEAPSTLKVPENTTDNNWMFVDAIYEGAEAYGWIPVNMDLCGIAPFTKSGLLLDNIHPNEAGTEKIVAYLSAELASYSETSKKETIIFNASAVSMKPGESTTLKAVLSPRSGTGTMTFTWRSSDSSVATVDASGKITAVAPGTAVITATAPNGISADISVSVVCEHTYEPGDVVIENEVASTWDKVGSYDEVVYCSVCGEEISRETKDALLYPFYNDAMELSSQLTLHFVIKLDTLGLGTNMTAVKQSGYYAVVTRLGADGNTYNTTIPATDWQGHTKNRMRIPFDDWKPTQMADVLNVVIYNNNDEAVSSAKETSVRQIAMYEIEQYSALGGYDDYVTLVVDMLNYGAASQESFGYNTGDYANALLTDAQKAYATADVEYSARQDTSSVTFYQAPAFELKSKVEMWLILTADFDVTNAVAEVSYTNFKGVVKTQTVTEFAEHTKGRHKLIINWLDIPDCTQDITVVFKDLQGNVLGTVHECVAASLGYFSELVPTDPIYPALVKFINSTYAWLSK